MTNDEYLKELASRGDGSLQAWFDAEHVDANDDFAAENDISAGNVDANDENATCNNSGDFVIDDDSREKLEDDIYDFLTDGGRMGIKQGELMTIIGWLDRQAEITAEESAEAWGDYSDSVQREIAELQADNDELRKRFSEIAELNGSAWQDGFEKGCESRDDAIAGWRVETDRLRDELAKRDKGIERLKRQRDTARTKIDELEAECDTCCYKTDYIEMDSYDVDRLEAERDALAADLRDCEQQRERLRQALGCAIDHAHEIVSLVNLDGEVIG